MSSNNRGTMAQEAEQTIFSSNSSSSTCKLGYGVSKVVCLKKMLPVG